MSTKPLRATALETFEVRPSVRNIEGFLFDMDDARDRDLYRDVLACATTFEIDVELQDEETDFSDLLQ